jgi:hypothetical protein
MAAIIIVRSVLGRIVFGASTLTLSSERVTVNFQTSAKPFLILVRVGIVTDVTDHEARDTIHQPGRLHLETKKAATEWR